MKGKDEGKKQIRSKFQRHVSVLIWKSYLQRQRRWHMLLTETLFAGALFLISVFTAKPVFMTPLQAEPVPPLVSADLLASSTKNILGYAPNTPPYDTIMKRASQLLQAEILAAASEDELNDKLYETSMGMRLNSSIIWVVWKPKEKNMWKFSIRSTERAKYVSKSEHVSVNPHLRAGFLGVQYAVSQAILEHASPATPKFEISLVSMPVSPLMQETRVRKAISGILLCFTLALIPPVLETQALVVHETLSEFKRALRIRNVDYASLYISWIVFAYLTALPICMLASITLILIFRWIHLLYALLIIVSYVSVTIMLALIMAMFHSKAWIACLWTTLFTLLQTFLAELLIHHGFIEHHSAVTFVLHTILPPLGLVHVFNQFALLQTGRGAVQGEQMSLVYTIFFWGLMNLLYFALLMLLQRTIGHDRAIGGQVSWKSIIFKKVEDVNKLAPIPKPTGKERANLQEVDELVAKAISFNNVSKSIMNVQVLSNITMDIYRGEFTMLMAERNQDKMLNTIEDLLAGLTYADEGTINVLGGDMAPGINFMTMSQMMGYCHRCKMLIKNLTVQEHLTLFLEICLWNEATEFVSEYGHIRYKSLLYDCDLEDVRHDYVKNLDVYYQAQLCWAIAMLLEPRIVLIPHFVDMPTYVSVIKDKIMHYKKYLTIVQMSYESIQLEYADRVFLLDNKILVFGGTPAYMFFKYGREYRVRMTFRSDSNINDDRIKELLERASEAGATVRAHLGSLLILRLPASPTANVASLVKDLSENANIYGMTSFTITLPDSEEVCKRAINESRNEEHDISTQTYSKEALKRLAYPCTWERTETLFLTLTHIKYIAWKFCAFYAHHRFILVTTIIAAIVAGVFFSLSLTNMLTRLERDRNAKKIMNGEVLTVEVMEQKTTLVLRTDNSSISKSVAKAYVMSETKAAVNQIKHMTYTALMRPESLTEYLVTRAIDSPQHYVYMYAYGMDVSIKNGTLNVQALYSPMHHDQGAAARSLARVYMALIRHFTGTLDATIEVTDDPLALDLTPFIKYAGRPPIVIQFFLILTISHITLLPSKEHGLVRHMQSHAMNCSPARYWFGLYVCDLILYWMLVGLMSLTMFAIMYFAVPSEHFLYSDLLVIPFLLVVYGLGCVPQAYLFSVGPRAALNSMTFVIANVVFGETTVIAKLLYGEALSYALYLMRISPQFNMAIAYVKIKQLFLYNSECVIFNKKQLCSSNTLHMCCEKCGILQKCYSRQNYLSQDGLLPEIISIMVTAVLFMTMTLLWEYRLIQRLWTFVVWMFIETQKDEKEMVSSSLARERAEVLDKLRQIKTGRSEKINTTGEYLLAANVGKKRMGMYIVRNVYFGLGKGEVLAISGIKRHGRLKLAEMLAGYEMPSVGQLWTVSKWKLSLHPHMYRRQVAICCHRNPVPTWMTVYDALELLAILRGVPTKTVHKEVWMYINALELHKQADVVVSKLEPNDRTRLHFAAAVVGAPPVIILDECTAYQKYSVRRAMYFILYQLRKRGHAIYVSSSSIECHMPMTSRLGILLDGRLYDIDSVDNLVERYSQKGFTVVVHLKDEVDIDWMFGRHFNSYIINDTTEVLVNVQVLDSDLNWATIFEKMERLQELNVQVYSYIVSAIPIDYIYNSIITNESGLKPTGDLLSFFCMKTLMAPKAKKTPSKQKLDELVPFKRKYDITTLKELPWSVIFHR